MDKFVIRGGNPLVGTIRVSGAKNSALPCMAAAILTEDAVTLENMPQVRDIETERKLLESMGAEVELREGESQDRTTICCRTLSRARSAGCARRHGACSHAGRMRHRRPSHRSAHQGPGADGRGDHPGAR